MEHIESDSGRILGWGASAEAKSTKATFEAGDVLYGKLRPYLNKVAQPDFDGVCSTDILVFKPSGIVNNSYLRYLLSSREVVGYADQNSKGINLPRISASSLGEFPAKVPPLAEQRRIVARLETLQEHSRRAKAALDQIPDLLDRYRQSVLAAAFRGDLTRDWRERHPDVEPATELLQRIRAERHRRWIEDKARQMTNRAEQRTRRKARPGTTPHARNAWKKSAPRRRRNTLSRSPSI